MAVALYPRVVDTDSTTRRVQANIAAAMRAAGVDAQELADRIGKSRETIYSYQKTKKWDQADAGDQGRIAALADALNVSASTLWGTLDSAVHEERAAYNPQRKLDALDEDNVEILLNTMVNPSASDEDRERARRVIKKHLLR